MLDNYAVARKKLKDAEQFSDINSGPDKEESLKRSRKIRAAKSIDESGSDDDTSDETTFTSQLPKPPQKRFRNVYSSNVSKYTNAQEGKE